MVHCIDEGPVISINGIRLGAERNRHRYPSMAGIHFFHLLSSSYSFHWTHWPCMCDTLRSNQMAFLSCNRYGVELSILLIVGIVLLFVKTPSVGGGALVYWSMPFHCRYQPNILQVKCVGFACKHNHSSILRLINKNFFPYPHLPFARIPKETTQRQASTNGNDFESIQFRCRHQQK